MASTHTDDQQAMLAAFEKECENSQDSTSDLQVKEEPEDTGYEQTSAPSVPSDQTSNADSRNSSPFPPVQFENSSPVHTRDSSPVPNMSGAGVQSSPQIPLNDLFAGSAIRSQLQGAIAGRKMDAVQNIVESLLKKNETLLAMSDAGGYKPNARRVRAAHDGVLKRSEPAFPPATGQGSVFPVSHSLQARINASKKTSDFLKQRMIRPKSPTRRHDGLLKDKTHFTYAMMESVANDHEIEEILNVQNHELVCAIGSKSYVTDTSNKVVASLEFGYYWCNFCPFSSNNKMLLIQHVLEHRFCCKYCPYESFCRSDILRHMYKMHQDFSETSGRLSYCSLLSDYMRVKARAEGKENTDPDEDVTDLDPQEIEATLQNTNVRKRKAGHNSSEDISSGSKSPKTGDGEDTHSSVQKRNSVSQKDRQGKSRKNQNPKRHPPPKESDYDVFDMEVEEISEPQQNMGPEDSETEKILYSSPSQASPNIPGKNQDNHCHSQSPGMPRIISVASGSSMQTFTPAVPPNLPVAKPPRNSYSTYRARPYKSRNSGSSSLYWSCGYCSFQSNSQAEIKDHSNHEHPGKPHRYVALIRNMTPDSAVSKGPKGNQPKVSTNRKPLNESSTAMRSTSLLPQVVQSPSGASTSPQSSNHSKTGGEDDLDTEDIVPLKDKTDSSALLKVKIHPTRSAKKETTVYRCYHCSYTARRHSAMKSHIYYKHRGKGLVAVDEDASSDLQVFFCARDDCTFKSESATEYLNHVEQCTPWNKPELADVEVEPHIRECLEQTVTFAEMAQEKISGRHISSPVSGSRHEVGEEDGGGAVCVHEDFPTDTGLSLELEEQGMESPDQDKHKLSPSEETMVPEENHRCVLETDECNVYNCNADDVHMSPCLPKTAECERPMGISLSPGSLDTPDEVAGENYESFRNEIEHSFSNQCKTAEVGVNESQASGSPTNAEEVLDDSGNFSMLPQSVLSEDNSFVPVGVVDIMPQEIVIEATVVVDSNISDPVLGQEVDPMQVGMGSPSEQDLVSYVEGQSCNNTPRESPKSVISHPVEVDSSAMSGAKQEQQEKVAEMKPDCVGNQDVMIYREEVHVGPKISLCLYQQRENQRAADEGKGERKPSMSSLKLKFKTVGDTIVCSMSDEQQVTTALNQDNTKDNESSGSSPDICEEEYNNSCFQKANLDPGKSHEDPKWLDDLLDSSLDSDNDIASNPRSIPLSVSSASEIWENSLDYTQKCSPSVEPLASCNESREAKAVSCMLTHSVSSAKEERVSQPTSARESEERLCFAYVPARSAAVKALTKMKPSLENDKCCSEEGSDDDIRSKKAPGKSKISSGTKSNIPTHPKTSAHCYGKSSVTPKSFTLPSSKIMAACDTDSEKSSAMYMCKYCVFGSGTLRKLKSHLMSKHRSQPLVVIQTRAQKRPRKCCFHLCPIDFCFKLLGSEEELETHKLIHQDLKTHSKHRERTTLNSLSCAENCSSVSNLESVIDASCKSSHLDKLPSCRVELDMLDLKKLKLMKTEVVKQVDRYACLYCTENHFDSSLAGMKSHYAAEHDGQLMVMRDTEARRAQLPSRIYVCDHPSCDNYYISRPDLDNHSKSHQTDKTYIYECACCGWYSASYSAANNHLKSEHTDEDSVSLVHMEVTIDEYGQTSKKILTSSSVVVK